MCFPHQQPERPHGDMGFDVSLLKTVLESFVDEISEESADLILDRPRFATAVVIVADGSDDICQATCTRQLDQVAVMDVARSMSIEEDDAIQRALRELLESREMLGSPRNSVCEGDQPLPSESNVPPPTVDQENNFSPASHPMGSATTDHLIKEINRSAQIINKTAIQFPSMNRRRAV